MRHAPILANFNGILMIDGSLKMEADEEIEDTELRPTKVERYYSKSRAQFLPLLSALLDDPLLADVPRNPTLGDVDTLIAVELGGAMRLSVLKMDGTTLDVAVLNSAKVRDLKVAVQRKVEELEQAQLGHRHVSWKHVWGNYCLCYMNEKLIDEDSLLSDFGIKTNDQVHFIHHLASREAGHHSHSRKRRFFHGLRKQ